MNNKWKKQPKQGVIISTLILFIALGIQLTIIAGPIKRNGAQIAAACFKRMPNASFAEAEGFIVGACDSQNPKDRAKFRLCVQNGKRKFKELKAGKR